MLIFYDFSRTKSIQTTLTNLTRTNLILFCVSREFFVGDINGFSLGAGYQKTKNKHKKQKNGHKKQKKWTQKAKNGRQKTNNGEEKQ
jgi:hypothetical protein